MILSKGVSSTRRLLHNGKGRPLLSPKSLGEISSRALQHRKNFYSIEGSLHHRTPLLGNLASPSTVRFSKRFASTITNEPLSATSIISPDSTASPSESFATSLDEIITSDLPHNIEQIGYLKELGLDFGWGPTAVVQTLLEYVHLYSGTTWGMSIIATAILVRLLLATFIINASDQAGRMSLIRDILQPIQARIKEARKAGDSSQVMVITQELRDLYQAAGIRFGVLFMPMIQVPIGFGTFRLLTGMANLPVPGLNGSEILWLSDLTVADPYYILPLITAGSFHYAVKNGGETGGQMNMTPGMQTIITYVVPSLTFFVIMFQPGCLQLTFATTSIISLIQGSLLRQPWIREALNITPLVQNFKVSPSSESNQPREINIIPRHTSSKAVPEKKGIINGAISEIKGAVSMVKAKAEQMARPKKTDQKTRRTPSELKRAKEYEKMRRKEIDLEELEEREAEERRREKRGKSERNN